MKPRNAVAHRERHRCAHSDGLNDETMASQAVALNNLRGVQRRQSAIRLLRHLWLSAAMTDARHYRNPPPNIPRGPRTRVLWVERGVRREERFATEPEATEFLAKLNSENRKFDSKPLQCSH